MSYSYGYSTNWDTSIRNIFDIAEKSLNNKRWNVLQDIEKWREKLVREVYDYEREQKALAEQEYRRQKTDLDSFRQQYTSLARQYIYDKQESQINQLLEQCRDMTFELGTLERSGPATPFIQFVAAEKLKQKTRNGPQAGKTADKIPQNNPDKSCDNYSKNSASAQSNESGWQIYPNPHQEK